MSRFAFAVTRRTLFSLFAGLMIVALLAGAAPVAQAASVPLNRMHTLARGPMQFGALDACANKVYMPVKDSDGNLRITGMGLTNSGLSNLSQQGNQHVGGAFNEVAITGLKGCNYFVTAVRTQNNALKLISWFSGANGFQRLGDSGNNGMAALEVDVTTVGASQALDSGFAIAAVRMANGYLALASYRVDGGVFELRDVALGEAASHIKIVAIPAPDTTFTAGRVVVAYRNAQQQLRLATYSVNNGGMLTLQAGSGNQAGVAQQIALTAYDSNRVVTAVKTAEGNLRMIPWHIAHDGSISRLHGGNDPTFNNPDAGAVSEIDVVAYPAQFSVYKHVVTAVRTAEGALKLIAWGIDGGDVVQLGNSGNQAGAATKIQVTWSENNRSIITSLRDGDGNLRVITWGVD